ncbi:MAG TPA: FAD-binding oxidoreductase [Gemmatimonadales bacterium]|nr:FAD-binding oxidoreductase [Gemmatimonadales bacterium]
MSDAIFDRLRNLLGPEGVERDQHGLPRAVPESDDAMALVCQAAHDAGWRCRLEGGGTWLPPDAPCDFALSTRGLRRIVAVRPADLTATVQAGIPLDALQSELTRHRLWLPIEPPGRPDRTIGSVVATGTAGPLRHGFGPVRDHVLGCTVVSSDGRVVESGGRVVKNVAGYDLTKLHTGGFGAFGAITDLHLRLRALPEVDVTVVATGVRHALVDAGRQLVASRIDLAALELLSPAFAARHDWTLAARLLGAGAGVAAEQERLAADTGLTWERFTPAQATVFWSIVARAPLAGPVAIRLGALADGLDDTIDLIAEELGDGLVAAGIGTGAMRWAGEAGAESLRTLRRRAATREIPLTLERGPWSLREKVGHFGAYREGVGHLVGRLRDTFDPTGIITVALEGRDG